MHLDEWSVSNTKYCIYLFVSFFILFLSKFHFEKSFYEFCNLLFISFVGILQINTNSSEALKRLVGMIKKNSRWAKNRRKGACFLGNVLAKPLKRRHYTD